MRKAMYLCLAIGVITCSISPPSRGDTPAPDERSIFAQEQPQAVAFAGLSTVNVYACRDYPEVSILIPVRTEAQAITTAIVSVGIKAELKNLYSTARSTLSSRQRLERQQLQRLPFDHGLYRS